MIRREVKWFGSVMDGEGYKSVETFADPYIDKSRGTPKPRKRWYVQSLDGTWYTTNCRDWEPEVEVADHVEMVIVGYHPGREPHGK